MATSSQKILAELVDQIASKQNLYRSCYSADLKRLETTHGNAAIASTRTVRKAEVGLRIRIFSKRAPTCILTVVHPTKDPFAHISDGIP